MLWLVLLIDGRITVSNAHVVRDEMKIRCVE